MFITIEGIDGAGKTTQAKILNNRLKEYGIDVVLTKEPNGESNFESSLTLNGKSVGSVTKDFVADGVCKDPLIELMMIYAARRDHIVGLLNPSLKDGKFVVCDRFYDLSIAYLGYRDSWDFESSKNAVDALHKVSAFNLKPDLTFVMDLKPNESMGRVSSRGFLGKYDRLDEESLEKIRNIFLQMAKIDKDRCIVIDGLGSEAEIADFMFQKVLERARIGRKISISDDKDVNDFNIMHGKNSAIMTC